MSVDLNLTEADRRLMDMLYETRPPVALYIHIDLPDDEISAIEEAFRERFQFSDVVKRATNYNLSGKPLREALKDHCQNIPKRDYDPFYFVAVVDKDWKKAGVIIVTLDNGQDDEICCIDQIRVSPVQEAGSFLVGLQFNRLKWWDYSFNLDTVSCIPCHPSRLTAFLTRKP
ncbi:hypothetical protein GGR51DRAFT_458478 [Nemania sp. FL0031]|nr:hypothetical protein GGR51DRAFT_458478 [Nemania sp. FL0031]